MKIIDRQKLDDLTRQARQDRRLRKNLNIHSSDDSWCHRLFNAIEPDSYIPPHRHLYPEKDESFLLIRGKLGILIFSEDGAVTETVLLEAGGAKVLVDIPQATFHTAVSLAEGTIFLEVKAGPYRPLTGKEMAPWAPLEGEQAGEYLVTLKELFSPR